MAKPFAVSRRALLTTAGMAGVAGVSIDAARIARAAPAGLLSPSMLGGWVEDAHGLPSYRVTADLPVRTTDAAGRSYPLDPDPFFLLGNYRLTVFPRASGLYSLVSGERGWTRLNEPAGGALQNAASLEIVRNGETTVHELLGLTGTCADARRTRRDFGCGFAHYEMQPAPDLGVVRTLSIAPSDDRAMGQPGLVVTIRVTNHGRTPCTFAYTESVLSSVALLEELGRPEAERHVRFANRIELDADRAFVAAHATAHADDPGILRGRGEANNYNLFPASLVLACPRTPGHDQAARASFGSRSVAPGATWLDAVVRGELAPRASRTMVFVVGLAPDQDPAELLAFAGALGAPQDGVYFAAEWRDALARFRTVADPLFRRELTWNSHALLAMATYNSFYGETFIPQGLRYDYELDLVAAPRDHLQHAMGAAYLRPALAKSTIRYVLSKMTSQGEIPYTDYGFGKTSNSAWNTSDQQLYLFQAVGEYLRITGDHAFLDEETAYLPHAAGVKGTVLEKLDRAMTYLRDNVSTGSHGLVRLLNSDWSDTLYADRSLLRYFWSAESHMNSAMLFAVAPTLLQQLERYAHDAAPAQAEIARRLMASLSLHSARVERAFYADLGDRTFSRRIYYDDKTPFGDDNLHLEPQAFLLQAHSYPVARKRALWNEMKTRIVAGEVLGPRQRETAVRDGLLAPFTNENGGFWFALAGQTIVGLASFDKAAAMSVLRMMTFDNFARHYPSYWTGLWSGPDTVNSVRAGAIAGLPRPEGEGWDRYASYCAHVHAWPIYAWSRIAEL